MQKRWKRAFVFYSIFLQITLLLGMVISITFFTANVSADDPVPSHAESVKTIAREGGYKAELTYTLTPIETPTPIPRFGGPAAGTKVPPPTIEKEKYRLFDKTIAEGGPAHLLEGLEFSLFAAGAIQLIGSIAGFDKTLTNSLTYSVVGGIMAGKALASFGQSGFKKLPVDSFFAKPGTQFAVGAAVAVAIFIATYKKEKKKLVSFQCLPFEPMIGGAKCEECNKDLLRPCSEYRCKSLGQACQLLNAGTKEEKCAWVNPKDVTSPKITPWTAALKPLQYKLSYAPDNSIRPPALGVKIISGAVAGGCVPAFTPLEFGITVNEPAQCKIDYNHTSSFEQMQYFFGESNLFEYNHTQKMRLPGPDKSEQGDLSPLLENDGAFSLYTRCRDANGNENVDEYVFNFCVDQGPDTTPPLIEEFSIPSGSPITFNQQSVSIEVYINEPSECKWSRESKAYNDMENILSCSTQSYQINSDLQYTCSGNLTGIKNREENKFYFRCKDQPGKPENERNVNVQSTPFVLRGSQQMYISKVLPNETIFGSTDVVPISLEVETTNGADEGISICYFSPSGSRDSYIAMFETNNYQHKQTLSLTSGNYNYFFRCIDAGGNAAESNISFNVFVDKQEPFITRAYKQEGLKIVTNEDAECTYSLTTCNFNFDEGLKLVYAKQDVKNNLFAEWKPSDVYYIKCRDQYGNQPSPNQCSIVVSAVEIEQQAEFA